MDTDVPPPAAAPASPGAAEPDRSAGFWLRGGAYMIDGLVLALISLLAAYLPEVPGLLARLLIPALYFTAMPVNARGQTLGKMAAGIAVVRNDGSPLTYGRALVRWLGYLLSTITLCSGFLCAVFTKNKRALQDYLADTRVVRVSDIGPVRKTAVVLAGVLFPPLVALGVIVAIALPNYEAMGARAKDAVALGKLGLLRSAAAAYSGDNQGTNPDLAALAPKYIADLPAPEIKDHPEAAGVEIYGAEVCSGSPEQGQQLLQDKLRDTGRWGYVVAPKAPCDGRIFVDCTHQDSDGRLWYRY
jgi:uncharacterized RDD family membrane protein YckC